MNSWEYMKCGREQGGEKAQELGVCPASTEKRLDKIHGGKNAGRSCWAVAGTLCGGTAQGTFAKKEHNCLACEFYKLVCREAGTGFKMSTPLLALLAA